LKPKTSLKTSDISSERLETQQEKPRFYQCFPSQKKGYISPCFVEGSCITTRVFSHWIQETLEFALREYEGAVVVVSHDRWRGTTKETWWIVGEVEVLNPTRECQSKSGLLAGWWFQIFPIFTPKIGEDSQF